MKYKTIFEFLVLFDITIYCLVNFAECRAPALSNQSADRKFSIYHRHDAIEQSDGPAHVPIPFQFTPEARHYSQASSFTN